MEFFTGALLITLGVITAFAILWLMSKAAKVTFVLWQIKRQRAFDKEVAKERSARAARTKEHFDSLAMEALENPEVKEIVEALRAVPYIDARTKAAKKQNYERQKLQTKLRKHVVDANIRGAIYNMAA